MDGEFLYFANHLLDEAECYQCETQFPKQQIRLKPTGAKEHDLEATYKCQECGIPYRIEVSNSRQSVLLDAFDERTESPTDASVITRSYRKSSLRVQNHSMHDLVENLQEIYGGLAIIETNHLRVEDRMEDVSFMDTTDREYTELEVDIHNYLSSAYSFHKILETVEPELSLEKLVEQRLTQVREKYRPIEGLRIYTQHHRSLPFGIGVFAPDRVSAGVKIENIDEIPKDITDENPDGYEKGAEYHYGSISVEYIEVDKKIHEHYEACERLVDGILTYIGEEYEEQLDDYAEKKDALTDFR